VHTFTLPSSHPVLARVQSVAVELPVALVALCAPLPVVQPPVRDKALVSKDGAAATDAPQLGDLRLATGKLKHEFTGLFKFRHRNVQSRTSSHHIKKFCIDR
jgi:hypothetical protein